MPDQPIAACGNDNSRTVLGVEDEDLLRTATAAALRRQGYRVVEAADVAEARQALQPGSAVDLVFSDVNMPGEETGLDLARWIGRTFPHIAVLLTSGQVGGDQVSGAPFLRKPYRSPEVLEAIRRLLGG